MKFSGFGYLIKEGVKSIWTNRMMSIASIGVLISCLLLTGTASLLSLNVSRAVDKVGSANVTRVFLKQEVTDLEAVQLSHEFGMLANVSKTEFISKEDALNGYEETLSEAVFDRLRGSENPLPNAIDVTMKDLSLYDQTVSDIKAFDKVDSVRDTREIATKLSNLNKLVNNMSIWIVLALTLVSIFIISNTIRMTMYSRRFEISIMKSVGATDAFVRIPFVIEGMTIGLISGILTSGLLFVLYDAIMKAIENIAKFNLVPYKEVALPISLIFILAGIVIGALGSLLSIGRYLRKEGNELLGW